MEMYYEDGFLKGIYSWGVFFITHSLIRRDTSHYVLKGLWFMVFNATFNNISVISQGLAPGHLFWPTYFFSCQLHSFGNFYMFGSILGCVLRCPKDKLCYKSLQKGLFKRSVQAIK